MPAKWIVRASSALNLFYRDKHYHYRFYTIHRIEMGNLCRKAQIQRDSGWNKHNIFLLSSYDDTNSVKLAIF